MTPGGARLAVRVRPGAPNDAVLERRADGVLKVSVRAPALEGRANAAVEKLIAVTLGVRGSQVKVTRGQASRDKVVEIAGITEAELAARLEALDGSEA